MLLHCAWSLCISASIVQSAPIQEAADHRHAAWTSAWKKRFADEIIAKAVAFCISQEERLKAIEVEYPEMRAQAAAARIEFDLQFDGALSNATADNAKAFGEAEQGIRKKSQEAITQAAFTREQSLEFIAQVTARTKGDLPEDIGHVLLSFHPDYDSRPHLEMLAGFKKEVPAADLQRSKGLKPMLQIPKSWKVLEPRRPNIVYLVKNKGGHGDLAMTMVVRSLDAETLAEVKADSRAVMNEALSVMPGRLFDKGEFNLNSDLAVWGKIIQTQEQVGVWIKTVQWVVMLMHDDRLVVITFLLGYGGENEGDLLDDESIIGEFKKFEVLNRLVLNSLTFKGDFEEAP